MPAVTEPGQTTTSSDSEASSQAVTHKEETEEEILNKIETEAMDVVADNLDSHAEDSILNEDEQTDKIVINSLEDSHYEDNVGEFKSLYEEDGDETLKSEKMEVDKIEITEEPVVPQIKDEDASIIEAGTQINDEEIEEESTTEIAVEPVVPRPIKEELIEPDTADEDPKIQSTPPDKSAEDEIDLLDISMVRETEEDDACAIADAIAMDDKDTQRSDEDQSEKTETEQDNSDNEEEDSHMDCEDDNAINTAASKEISDDSNEVVVDKENGLVVVEDDAQSDKTDKINDQDKEGDDSESELVMDEDNDKRKSKRTLSNDSIDKLTAKKPKLVNGTSNEEPPQDKSDASSEAPPKETPEPYKIQTLNSFAEFMKDRTLTKKLSRSDLEEICLQKICEVLVLKSSHGELNDTIRKHEECLAAFRKDIHQIHKQYRDLDIVHKKLLAELKSLKEENVVKPLVPLKITRSVGLQVRLTPGHDANQNRRKPLAQPKTILSPLGRQVVKKVGQQPAPVRQVLSSPQKPIAKPTPASNAPMLSQALQKQRPKPVIAKRTAASPIKKPVETPKKASGVIDLTDEDDKRSGSNGIQFRTVSASNTTRVVSNGNKAPPAKPSPNQNKPATKLPPALPQGLRLTPASVISSTTTSSPQMLYVVPTITSNAGGQQKVAFVNFQPSNAMLSGTINGAVLNKPGQSLTIKNVATTSTVSSSSRPKHPAPLPVAIRVNSDSNLKLTLPKPLLTIKKLDNGIILQWKMPYNLDLYEKIASYQLYAYQETTSLPSSEMWRKVGDVKALALPMACTLTQFADKNKYYFAVRAVDVFQRIGAFSEPEEISL